jgi:hypothetical protein
MSINTPIIINNVLTTSAHISKYLHLYKYKCYEDSDDDDVDDIVISIENPQFTKIKQRLETKYKIKFPSIEEIKNSKKDHTEIQLN